MSAESVGRTRSRVFGGTYRTFYSTPLVVDSASGCVITDVEGRDYLDAYNNVPVLGHSDAAVREAVDAQLGRANVHTRYLDELVVDYAQRLVALFPDCIESLVFACSGSEANDLALRLAAHATGHDGVIVTAHAYHGTTSAAAAISPSLVGTEIGDHVETVDLPAFDDGQFDTVLAAGLRAAATRLSDRGHPLGAFILDSAMTSDGISQPRSLAQTAATVRELGGVYIADEVQSGFGRTGSAWGFEQLDVVPDLVTLGKPMGNGLPVAAVLGSHEVFDSFGASQRYFNTFAGTAVPVAAAEVVLSALESGALTARADDGGALLEELLLAATADSSPPVQIRRSGLMVGIDFASPSTAAAKAVPVETAARRAKTMVEYLYDEHILVSSTGAAATVLKIRPPLIITDEQLRQLVDGFRRALTRLDDAEASDVARPDNGS